MLLKQHKSEETDEESFASIISISNESSEDLLKVNQSYVEVSLYSVINFSHAEYQGHTEIIKRISPPIGKAHCSICLLF
ncbi:unnamed protein product [Blepharisma stoltei]|uniref:Uncharacterized protein n=1 Tax=Blepharisma stoltei TaxID=1481888 RepID=A0AAU9JAL7_9CILI|nr:unnamed protein product [Blepharisma stoltei]